MDLRDPTACRDGDDDYDRLRPAARHGRRPVRRTGRRRAGTTSAEYEELRPESSRGRRVLIVLARRRPGPRPRGRGRRVLRAGPARPQRRAGRPASSSSSRPGCRPTPWPSKLEDEGVIVDAQIFRAYLRYRGTDGFQAGNYDLFENMAAWDVVDVLEAPPRPPDSVVFEVPPGLTVAEIPAAITDDIPSFDAAAIGGAARRGHDPAGHAAAGGHLARGLRLPRPLRHPPRPGPRSGHRADGAAVRRRRRGARPRQPGRGARADAVRDRHHRLADRGGVRHPRGDGQDRPGDLQPARDRRAARASTPPAATRPSSPGATATTSTSSRDSPYNTRRQAGLPPTPIAQPSRAALEAALAPADGPWIFYVRDPDTSRTPAGGHFFTDSAREFAEVKAECEAAGLGCG